MLNFSYQHHIDRIVLIDLQAGYQFPRATEHKFYTEYKHTLLFICYIYFFFLFFFKLELIRLPCELDIDGEFMAVLFH